MDIIILGLACLVIIGILKRQSDAPVDADGKMIISNRERIIGVGMSVLVLLGILFVRTDHFKDPDPVVFISMIVIGITAIWMVLRNNKKK